MFGKMFGHINLIGKSLDATWTRQEVISHNIANAETPNYNAQRVEFEPMFRQALQNAGNFETKTTRPKHVKPAMSDPLAVQPFIVADTHYTMRMDGNNVDIDHEMANLAQNTILYNELVNKANMEFTRYRIAITGSR